MNNLLQIKKFFTHCNEFSELTNLHIDKINNLIQNDLIELTTDKILLRYYGIYQMEKGKEREAINFFEMSYQSGDFKSLFYLYKLNPECIDKMLENNYEKILKFATYFYDNELEKFEFYMKKAAALEFEFKGSGKCNYILALYYEFDCELLANDYMEKSKLLKYDPIFESPRVNNFDLGKYYESIGFFSFALRYYFEAAKNGKIIAYIRIGKIYSKFGDLEKMEEYFKLAGIYGTFALAQFYVTSQTYLKNQEDYEKMIYCFNELLEKKFVGIYGLIGKYCEDISEYEEMHQYYQKSVENKELFGMYQYACYYKNIEYNFSKMKYLLKILAFEKHELAIKDLIEYYENIGNESKVCLYQQILNSLVYKNKLDNIISNLKN